MTEDKEQVLAYYPQVLQDIRDIKARPWSFITILVVITGGILSFEVERIASVRYWLFIGLCVAAGATFFISIQSWNKLKCSRKALDSIYAELDALNRLRDISKGEDDVKKPDWGDKMFLGIGLFAAALSVLMVFCHLFATPECAWRLCF